MIPDFSLGALRQAYHAGETTPAQVMADIRERSAEHADHNIWIHLLSEQELDPYLRRLAQLEPDRYPLWGIPFAIKDNIDLAGIPTTAACPAFAYTPDTSAYVVDRLLDAGAIPVGKTNLDQFATGLVGTRSPYGPGVNAFNKRYISGGSSAGSAVAVALGLAAFSLGSDTAGSGRVPAAFNNLVGVKPTRGLLSSSGMVPACQSLDCMSIFALNTDDAAVVLDLCIEEDRKDPYSRPNTFSNNARHYGRWQEQLKIGVIAPDQLKFFGDKGYSGAYQVALDRLSASGVRTVEIDFSLFDTAARLLYEGPWVAERYIACHPLIEQQPEALLPVTRGIIEPGGQSLASDLFRAQYRMEKLKREAREVLATVDCLMTPTAGRLFTLEEITAEPVKRNSELGYYTNYMNLLDLCALAIQAGFTDSGLPFGVTLVADAFNDQKLLSVANRLQTELGGSQGAGCHVFPDASRMPVAYQPDIPLVVCGAHLEGLALNWQLVERGASLMERTFTAAAYRFYALSGGPPYRPGLVRSEDGAAIGVEVWSVPADQFGSFVAGIPSPLAIGKVELADGRLLSGFLCEASGLNGAEEITSLGGWRAYLDSLSS
jgi:allophanate hydrolase